MANINGTQGDDPIHPVIVNGMDDEGLTKREHFAIQIMTGMTSSLAGLETGEITEAVSWSVWAADELIKALNK